MLCQVKFAPFRFNQPIRRYNSYKAFTKNVLNDFKSNFNSNKIHDLKINLDLNSNANKYIVSFTYKPYHENDGNLESFSPLLLDVQKALNHIIDKDRFIKDLTNELNDFNSNIKTNIKLEDDKPIFDVQVTLK